MSQNKKLKRKALLRPHINMEIIVVLKETKKSNENLIPVLTLAPPFVCSESHFDQSNPRFFA